MALEPCTFDELKRLAKRFLDRLAAASPEGIENGWTMFALSYLNTTMDDGQRESEGPALFRVIHREYARATIAKATGQ